LIAATVCLPIFERIFATSPSPPPFFSDSLIGSHFIGTSNGKRLGAKSRRETENTMAIYN
jgi:hypothetical protein